MLASFSEFGNRSENNVVMGRLVLVTLAHSLTGVSVNSLYRRLIRISGKRIYDVLLLIKAHLLYINFGNVD